MVRLATAADAEQLNILTMNLTARERLLQSSKKLYVWAEQAEKYRNGDISREEYDRWRYRYPEFDTTQRWVKVPTQTLSDMLVEAIESETE